MKKKLILIGLDKDLIDQVEIEGSWTVEGIIDKNREKISQNYKFLGNDKDYQNKSSKPFFLFALDNPKLKKTLIDNYYDNQKFINFFSNNCYISKSAKIGIGNIFQRNVKIMTDVQIGNHCKINIDVCVHHDSKIGNFNTLCPGVRLLGNVKLGNNIFIGSAATIFPNIKIGNNSIIGAGAVVNKNIEENKKVIGVPAK